MQTHRISAQRGNLVVVGSGIKGLAHLTSEAKVSLESADKVVYLLADFLTEDWIQKTLPHAENLHRYYSDHKPRAQTYEEMCEYIVSLVRQGLSVCAIYYGHPGVFAAPTHMAIAQARKEGYEATMLPGISAEDCLFADLGIDPAVTGCQSFEATDFLLYDRIFDPTASLVLWQIGVLGHLDYRDDGYDSKHLAILVERLLHSYPQDHLVTVYEAAIYSPCKPRIETIPLRTLTEARVSSMSTLFVPAYGFKSAKPDMIEKLGIPERFVKKVKIQTGTGMNTPAQVAMAEAVVTA